MNIYGIIDKNNCLIDISKSIRGAKQYATKNGYDKVGYRNVNSYNAFITHIKIGKKWYEVEQENEFDTLEKEQRAYDDTLAERNYLENR